MTTPTPKRLKRSVAVAAAAAVVVVGMTLTLAPGAYAGWQPAVTIGSGGPPLVAFAPSGQAALAFQDKAGATYLVRRAPRGRFSAPALVRSAGPLKPVPKSLVLPAGGDTALLFKNSDGSIDALVEPASASAFGAPQQLEGSEQGGASIPQASLLATTRGEVIAAVVNAANADAFSRVLPRGGRTFGVHVELPNNPLALPALAADEAGGAFVADDGGYVAYRRAGGEFGSGRSLAPPETPGRRFVIGAGGIGAGGNGYAAFDEVYGGARLGHVAIYVGRAARFGRPRLLARTQSGENTSLARPVVDRDGNVSVAWDECGSRGLGCSIGAARGTVHGRFGRPRTLARTSKTTKARISVAVGDGIVALERCRGVRRSISVALADRHHGFDKPHEITADGRLVPLGGGSLLPGGRDARGDQLIVWTAGNGSLWATAQKPGSRSFGPPQRLSPPRAKLDSSTVTAAFGPRGEAIVAWKLAAGGAMAAVYQAPR